MSSRLSLLAARTALILLAPLGYGILLLEAPEYLRFAGEGIIRSSITLNAANEFVLHPAPNGPANRAGVAEGDILLAVDGVPVSASREVSELGLRGPIGDTVFVDVRGEAGLRRIPIVRSDDLAAVNRDFGITMRGRTWYLFLLDLLPSITFTLAGIVIVLRGWNRTFGVLLALVFFLFAAGFTNVLNFAAATSLPAKAIVFGSLIATGAILALFPDGRMVPRWGRWIIVGWGAMGLVSTINVFQSTIPSWIRDLLFAVIVGMGAAAQFERYRAHSSELQRRQIKLVVFSFVAIFVGYVTFALPATYLTAVGRWEALYRYELVGFPLMILPIAMLPVAIAVAVSKHGLWDVDTLINRSAVFSVVTIVLGIMWAATAVLLQATLELFIGRYSTIAAAAVSSLQVAALFQPLRTRTQSWIDQRFPRESYIIERKLEQLARDVAHSLDVDVIPFVDTRLRSILGNDEVQWCDGRVRVSGVVAGLQSKEVRRALETFAQTTAPYIAIREAIKLAMQKDASLPR